eukprot:jgi/Tetstr1/423533/TSEL_014206.t1
MYSDSELESPEKPPSAKRNTDTAESNPVSRLSQWTHLYDGFDSSPGASPAPPSNYSRNAQRNPAYLESDSDAAVTPGSTRTGHSAAVAPWSDNAAAVAAELACLRVKLQPHLLESPSESSTVAYTPKGSPADEAFKGLKTSAEETMASLEGQISELNLAMKQFKGLSQFQAPRLAALEEAVPRLQVAVEDISAWMEELNNIVSESGDVQASLKESHSNTSKTMQSFQERLSVMETSVSNALEKDDGNTPSQMDDATIMLRLREEVSQQISQALAQTANHAGGKPTGATLVKGPPAVKKSQQYINCQGRMDVVNVAVGQLNEYSMAGLHIMKNMASEMPIRTRHAVSLTIENIASLSSKWLPGIQAYCGHVLTWSGEAVAQLSHSMAMASRSAMSLLANCLLNAQYCIQMMWQYTQDAVTMALPKVQDFAEGALHSFKNVVGVQ